MRRKGLLNAVVLVALGCQSQPLPPQQAASVQDSIALSVVGPATVEFTGYRYKGDGQDLVTTAIICPLGLLLNPLTAVVVVTHCVGTGLLATGISITTLAPRLDLQAIEALVDEGVEGDSLDERMTSALRGYAALAAPGFEFDGSDGPSTTLEISNVRVILHSDGREPIRIAPQIAATVRLLAAAGEELDRFDLSLFAPTRSAEVLFAEDGLALQDVLEVLLECIAERAFDEFLLVVRDPGPVAPGESLVPDFALKPLAPVLATDYRAFFKDFAEKLSPRSFASEVAYAFGLRDSAPVYSEESTALLLGRASVSDLAPTFQWEAQPRAWQAAPPESQEAGPRKIAYDLRIYDLGIYLDTSVERGFNMSHITIPFYPGASRAVYARYGLH